MTKTYELIDERTIMADIDEKHHTATVSVYALNDLVEAVNKVGHWILTDDDFVYCSECEDSYYPRPIDASWYFCPHCGAKMESED